MSLTGRGPTYNRRRGSGNIRSGNLLGRGIGRQTDSGAVFLDVDFNWYGDEIMNRVDSALINAMDRLLDEAVELARPIARIRTGDLRASIMKLQIIVQKDKIHGEYGSALHYALYQELGTFQFSGTFYLSNAGAAVGARFTEFVQDAMKAAGL